MSRSAEVKECCHEFTEFLGMLFTVTADGKLSIAEFVRTAAADGSPPSSSSPAGNGTEKTAAAKAPPSSSSGPYILRLTALESECYYDDAAGTCEHLFDVFLEDAPAVLHASVCGARIKKIVRLN